tara:strand:- start:158 stop:1120 length:963 start_codon:yes stop_codon:yes gene_type:complete
MKIFENKNNWLVTGGAGFIGSHLIEDLIDNNQRIYCVDDFSSGLRENLKKNKYLKVIKSRIQNLDKKLLDYKFKGIFHLASQVSAPKSIKSMYSSSSNNLLSSLKVWDIAKKMKTPIVYASSSAVYGNLSVGDDQIETSSILSPYSMDKLSIENYANLFWRLYGIPSVGLRFFNVYGPRQDASSPYSGVISIFLDRLLSNEIITVNGGYQTRDFIYVKDVSQVLIKSMNYCFQEKDCDVFNVGTGKSISINHLIRIISNLLKIEPKIIRKELPKGDPEISNCKTEKIKNKMQIEVHNFSALEKGLTLLLKHLKNTKKYPN